MLSDLNIIALLKDTAPAPSKWVFTYEPAFRIINAIFLLTIFTNAVMLALLNDHQTSYRTSKVLSPQIEPATSTFPINQALISTSTPLPEVQLPVLPVQVEPVQISSPNGIHPSESLYP